MPLKIGDVKANTVAKDYLIYGIHPVLEALRAGKEIDKILIQTGLKGDVFREINQFVKDRQIPFQAVPIQKLNKIYAGNHQGLLAFISPVVYHDISDLIPRLYDEGIVPFLLILDRVTDVRNFGAIARTAECAGVHGIIIPSRGAAQVTEDAIRTSSGALLRIPVCRSNNLKDTLTYLKNSGINIVAVTEKAQTLYDEVPYDMPVALLLGSEEDGISPSYLKLAGSAVRIPLEGSIESLNVSVAAGITLFEVLRYRRHNP